MGILGAAVGAALDRRDGDSGIKGAIAGSLAQRGIGKLFPVLGALAFGVVAHRVLKRSGLFTADERSGA